MLPCLASELHGPGLKGIVDTLRGVPYLRQIVVSISGADEERGEYEDMRQLFEGVRGHRRLGRRSCSGTAVRGSRRSTSASPRKGSIRARNGKGRSTWLAFGYVLATNVARVIAVHDCDIRTYDRELLARLCYPTAHPNLHYEFAKGYYGRVADRLYGRVTRLFVTPLLRAMKAVLGSHPLLDYLDSFRYPLAGEVSMTTDLARINRIPADWGLEIGTLVEVYRNSLAEADLPGRARRELRPPPPGAVGERRHRRVCTAWCVDIASSAIRNLASYGVEFDAGFLNTLTAAYRRTAQDAISSYSDDAALNGLVFERHEEELAVETFTRALRVAGLGFVRDPMDVPQIPNWNRVASALPGFLDELREAVEADAADS